MRVSPNHQIVTLRNFQRLQLQGVQCRLCGSAVSCCLFLIGRLRKRPQGKERGERRKREGRKESRSPSLSLAKEQERAAAARKWAGSKTPSPPQTDRASRVAERSVSVCRWGAGAVRHSGKSQKLRTASRGANDRQDGWKDGCECDPGQLGTMECVRERRQRSASSC